MSVLIVVNVVSGAVIEGTRRIGVLKSVGFTPVQVVSVYVLQVTVPAAAGVAAGAVLANVLGASLLSRTSEVLAVAPQFIPPWVDLTVPLAGLAIAVAGALAPASWAARTPTALALRAE
jgi:putative ABC transport system permease protein